MQNLKKPNKRSIFYDRIIAAKKNKATRNRLKTIGPKVKKGYAKYCLAATKNNLNKFTTSSFSKSDREKLLHCYSSRKEVIALKDYIRNLQPNYLRKACQYCMVGTSDTFDHYLPESIFSEFSVLANNLIPACDYCNRKKSGNWKNASNERTVINFYYDKIPNGQFLNCIVTMSGKITNAQFSLIKNKHFNNSKFAHIVRHFSQLNTLERIHDSCPTEIEAITSGLKALTSALTLRQASNFLRNDAIGLKNKFGSNYCWAVLRDALSKSKPFLTSLGFK